MVARRRVLISVPSCGFCGSASISLHLNRKVPEAMLLIAKSAESCSNVYWPILRWSASPLGEDLLCRLLPMQRAFASVVRNRPRIRGYSPLMICEACKLVWLSFMMRAHHRWLCFLQNFVRRTESASPLPRTASRKRRSQTGAGRRDRHSKSYSRRGHDGQAMCIISR